MCDFLFAKKIILLTKNLIFNFKKNKFIKNKRNSHEKNIITFC